MNFSEWYTDTAEIYRVVQTAEGAITRNTRTKIAEGVKCRVYRSAVKTANMTQTSAEYSAIEKLMLPLGTDILPNDELIVSRGSGSFRAFAGAVYEYTEPFGGVMPELAHIEVALLRMERIE